MVKAFISGREVRNMDDNRIVELYLARDEAAIAETRRKYGSKLRKISYALIRDHAYAEECEYEAYYEAWKLIPPNEPREYLFAFMARIVRHISIDRCRKNSKTAAVLCELTEEMAQCLPSPGSAEDGAAEGELAASISLFLSACTKEKRGIFLRRYWFFDSVPQIAARYGITKSKVKTTLFRMRNDLKEFLRKEGYSI